MKDIKAFRQTSERNSSDLKPAAVKEKLQQGEDGDVKVEVMAGVTLGGVEKLTTDQTSEEEGVDSKSDDLKTEIQISPAAHPTQSSDFITLIIPDVIT